MNNKFSILNSHHLKKYYFTFTKKKMSINICFGQMENSLQRSCFLVLSI